MSQANGFEDLMQELVNVPGVRGAFVFTKNENPCSFWSEAEAGGKSSDHFLRRLSQMIKRIGDANDRIELRFAEGRFFIHTLSADKTLACLTEKKVNLPLLALTLDEIQDISASDIGVGVEMQSVTGLSSETQIPSEAEHHNENHSEISAAESRSQVNDEKSFEVSTASAAESDAASKNTAQVGEAVYQEDEVSPSFATGRLPAMERLSADKTDETVISISADEQEPVADGSSAMEPVSASHRATGFHSWSHLGKADIAEGTELTAGTSLDTSDAESFNPVVMAEQSETELSKVQHVDASPDESDNEPGYENISEASAELSMQPAPETEAQPSGNITSFSEIAAGLNDISMIAAVQLGHSMVASYLRQTRPAAWKETFQISMDAIITVTGSDAAPAPDDLARAESWTQEFMEKCQMVVLDLPQSVMVPLNAEARALLAPGHQAEGQWMILCQKSYLPHK
jgi:predicted regulator of Ras-like GTPase activity (Roadblock/LC7/MglB family)